MTDRSHFSDWSLPEFLRWLARNAPVSGQVSAELECRAVVAEKLAESAARVQAPGHWVYQVDPQQPNRGRLVLARPVGAVEWVGSILWNGHYLEATQTAFGEFIAASKNALAAPGGVQG